MAHNFQRHITLGLDPATCAFVSKAGVDTNNGLTPDTPVATFAAALAVGRSNIIVGTGVYRRQKVEGFQRRNKFFADGTVTLLGTSQDSLLAMTDPDISFYDFVIAGYGVVYTMNVGYAGFKPRIERCLILGGILDTGFDSYDPLEVVSCTLVGVTSRVTNPGHSYQMSYYNCNLIGCTLQQGNLVNCYVDATSTLTINEDNTNATNNNIQCPITIAGTTYPNLAAQRVAKPAINTNSINQSPKFNNQLRRDYTLLYSSPHLAPGIGPRHLRYAQGYYAQSLASPGELCTTDNTWLVNSADNSIIQFLELTGFGWSGQGSLYVLENSNGNFEASYKTAPIQIAAVTQTLTYLSVLAGLNYDSDYPAAETSFNSNLPESYNNNVPVLANYASGNASRNPHHLTIGMRWSTAQAPQDGTASSWVTGTDFLAFQINARPTWNQTTRRGNGDALFDPAAANVQDVRALWTQYQGIIRNNYYSK